MDTDRETKREHFPKNRQTLFLSILLNLTFDKNRQMAPAALYNGATKYSTHLPLIYFQILWGWDFDNLNFRVLNIRFSNRIFWGFIFWWLDNLGFRDNQATKLWNMKYLRQNVDDILGSHFMDQIFWGSLFWTLRYFGDAITQVPALVKKVMVSAPPPGQENNTRRWKTK